MREAWKAAGGLVHIIALPDMGMVLGCLYV
jgi:hypothetical protein